MVWPSKVVVVPPHPVEGIAKIAPCTAGKHMPELWLQGWRFAPTDVPVGVTVGVAVLVGVPVGVTVGIVALVDVPVGEFVVVGVLVDVSVGIAVGVVVDVVLTLRITAPRSRTLRWSKVCTKMRSDAVGGFAKLKLRLFGPTALPLGRRTNRAPRAAPPETASVLAEASAARVAPALKPLTPIAPTSAKEILAGNVTSTLPPLGIAVAVVKFRV